ncbi:MAG: hypothetical protein K0U72_05030 [Gammaproteobacteria bacterium]|nr:hypothetical protein [Gammaproteobacteria bacterium]
MNCFSGTLFLTSALFISACSAPASETPDSNGKNEYQVHYDVTADPGEGIVRVELQLKQPRALLRELSFSTRDALQDIVADGELQIDDARVTWQPPRGGGSLRWAMSVNSKRGEGGYDAYMNSDWAIFRAEDIIPRSRTRTLKGASSDTTMSIHTPAGWSAISQYSTLQSRIEIETPGRRFEQPSGWIAIGKLGVRRETIAGIRVAVVGPESQSIRRMDMLALLNWTLPELAQLLPDAMPRLTIISAADPMWRGGLSAPASLFIHSDRPLISENGTSTLLHEVMHVALGLRSVEGNDWITEGLAEYYSLQLLRRGNAITKRRYTTAIKKQQEWAADATVLCQSVSSGADTALAVVTMAALDQEIREQSAGKHNLDDVVAELHKHPARLDLEALKTIVETMTMQASDVLHSKNLPGCHTLARNTDL